MRRGFVGSAALVGALVALLAACTSDDQRGAVSSIATSPSTGIATLTPPAPPATSAVAPSASPPPALIVEGFAEVQGADDAAIYVKVSSPHAVGYLDGRRPRMLVAYVLTIATDETESVLDPMQVQLGSSGPLADDSPRKASARACGSTPLWDDAATDAGLDENDIYGDFGATAYDLPSQMAPLRACFVFDLNFVAQLPPLYVATEDELEAASIPTALVKAPLRIKVPQRPTPPPPPRVTLMIFGNGSTSSTITYSLGFSIEQATDARLPWTRKISPDYDFYQVSAQDGDGTSITCEIIDTDGTVLSKHTSTGLYAIADCTSGI